MPIPEALLRAYVGAEYVVLAQPSFVLRIGEPSPPLQAMMDAARVRTAAFLTACNPGSERWSDERNRAAMRALEREVARRECSFFPGEGRDPEGVWPAEPGLLVLGLQREDFEALGRAFAQNAIVVVERDAAPELVLLA